ncbi:hypothetical protein RF11_15843 [Thelohanellus kitauei]|uniref:Uncharacterized protein n=1 Tax=Thelohanellus kitauei TaxID=669202 RepID=A0A0C2I949_THEKT|nr:hypothetical protein RF11_15843 [Thelohanellus kitauei]
MIYSLYVWCLTSCLMSHANTWYDQNQILSLYEPESDTDDDTKSTSQDQKLPKNEPQIRRVHQNPQQSKFEKARGMISSKFTETLASTSSHGAHEILPVYSDIKTEPMESTEIPRFEQIKGISRYRVIKSIHSIELTEDSGESSQIQYEVIPFDSDQSGGYAHSQQSSSLVKSESDASSDSNGHYWRHIKPEPTDESFSEVNIDTSTLPNTPRVSSPTEMIQSIVKSESDENSGSIGKHWRKIEPEPSDESSYELDTEVPSTSQRVPSPTSMKSPSPSIDLDTASLSTGNDELDKSPETSVEPPKRVGKSRAKKSTQSALEKLAVDRPALQSENELGSQSTENTDQPSQNVDAGEHSRKKRRRTKNKSAQRQEQGRERQRRRREKVKADESLNKETVIVQPLDNEPGTSVNPNIPSIEESERFADFEIMQKSYTSDPKESSMTVEPEKAERTDETPGTSEEPDIYSRLMEALSDDNKQERLDAIEEKNEMLRLEEAVMRT